MKLASNATSQLEAFAKNSDMRLSENDPWIARAALLPWKELEKECDEETRPAFRMLFAACLIQAQLGTSDGETAARIQESPYLQYFCGMDGYNGLNAPFEPSELKSFRERLDDRELNRIKELICKAR